MSRRSSFFLPGSERPSRKKSSDLSSPLPVSPIEEAKFRQNKRQIVQTMLSSEESLLKELRSRKVKTPVEAAKLSNEIEGTQDRIKRLKQQLSNEASSSVAGPEQENLPATIPHSLKRGNSRSLTDLKCQREYSSSRDSTPLKVSIKQLSSEVTTEFSNPKVTKSENHDNKIVASSFHSIAHEDCHPIQGSRQQHAKSLPSLMMVNSEVEQQFQTLNRTTKSCPNLSLEELLNMSGAVEYRKVQKPTVEKRLSRSVSSHSMSSQSLSSFGTYMDDIDEDTYGQPLGTNVQHQLSNLKSLSTHPLHSTFLLQYLIRTAKNPGSFLLYFFLKHFPNLRNNLRAASKNPEKTVQTLKRWCLELFSVFLHSNSPLFINIDRSLCEVVFSKIAAAKKLAEIYNVFECIEPSLIDIADTLRRQYVDELNRGMCFSDEIDEFSRLEKNLKSNQLRLEVDEAGRRLNELLECLQTDHSISQVWRGCAKSALILSLISFMQLNKISWKLALTNYAKDIIPFFTTKIKMSTGSSIISAATSKSLKIVQGHKFQAFSFEAEIICCSLCHQLVWGTGHTHLTCLDCGCSIHLSCLGNMLPSCSQTALQHKPSNLLDIFRRSRSPISLTNSAKNMSADILIHSSVNKSFTKRSSSQDTKIDFQQQKEFASQLNNEKHVQKTCQDSSVSEISSPTTTTTKKSGTQDPSSFGHLTEARQLIMEECDLRHRSEPNKTSIEKAKQAYQKESCLFSSPLDTKSLESVTRPKTTGIMQDSSSMSGSLKKKKIGYYRSNKFAPTTILDDAYLTSDGVMADQQSPHRNDMCFDDEIKPLRELVPQVLAAMPHVEAQKQEIIYQLICSEKVHIKRLEIMHNFFLEPLKKQQIPGVDNVKMDKILFTNLQDLIEFHASFHKKLSSKLDESFMMKDLNDFAQIVLTHLSGRSGVQYIEHVFNFHTKYKKERILLLNSNPPLMAFVEQTNSKCHLLLNQMKFKDLYQLEYRRIARYQLLMNALVKKMNNSDERHLAENISKAVRDLAEKLDAKIEEHNTVSRLKLICDKLDLSSMSKKEMGKLPKELRQFNLLKNRPLFDTEAECQVIKSLNNAHRHKIHLLLYSKFLCILFESELGYTLQAHFPNSLPVEKDGHLGSNDKDNVTTLVPIEDIIDISSLDSVIEENFYIFCKMGKKKEDLTQLRFYVSSLKISQTVIDLVTGSCDYGKASLTAHGKKHKSAAQKILRNESLKQCNVVNVPSEIKIAQPENNNETDSNSFIFELSDGEHSSGWEPNECSTLTNEYGSHIIADSQNIRHNRIQRIKKLRKERSNSSPLIFPRTKSQDCSEDDSTSTHIEKASNKLDLENESGKEYNFTSISSEDRSTLQKSQDPVASITQDLTMLIRLVENAAATPAQRIFSTKKKLDALDLVRCMLSTYPDTMPEPKEMPNAITTETATSSSTGPMTHVFVKDSDCVEAFSTETKTEIFVNGFTQRLEAELLSTIRSMIDKMQFVSKQMNPTRLNHSATQTVNEGVVASGQF